MIDLFKALLNMDSQNPPGNERVLAEYIRDCLAGSNAETVVQDLGGGRANVIARLRGRERGGALMLNGHLDTVPNGSGWETDPQQAAERNGRIYARGASDMKSGLAVMLYAFGELARSGAQPARDVLFAGTCDEESGGLGAKAVAEAGWLDGVETILIGEPTHLGLGMAAKGCLWLKIRAEGRTSHGAYPERGVNAIDGLFAFARALRERVAGGGHPLLGGATATLTCITGGVKANMVPDRAEATIDVRTLPGMDHARVVESARALAAEICRDQPGLHLEIAVENDRMPVETRLHSRLAGRMEALWQARFGRPMAHAGTAFFSDASVFLRYADCDVIQFGPGDSALAHTPNEYVEIAAMRDALALMRDLLKEA